MEKSKGNSVKIRALHDPEGHEACIRQLADNIRGVLYIHDARLGRISYASAGFEEIWQRPRDSAPHALLDSVHAEDRKLVRDAMERNALGAVTREEYRIVRPDGSVRWIEDRAFPVKSASGEIAKIAGLALDITESKAEEESRRAAEERERQSLNLEALEKLAGSVAHEFNNLLTSINGYSDILMCRMAADDANRPLAEEIRNAGDHAAQVTRDLLAFGLKCRARSAAGGGPPEARPSWKPSSPQNSAPSDQ